MIEDYPMPTQGAAGQLMAKRKPDLTLRQNIDAQIAQTQAHLDSLVATKERMEKSGIIDMRIEDLQTAMRF